MEFQALTVCRRSVRGYSEGVPHEILREILKTAQQAPSWKNSQTARYYVAESPEALEKVRAAMPGFNQKSSLNATLVVVTYQQGVAGFTAGTPDNEIGNGWGAYDLGLCSAYLILAARDRGYDSLIMGLRDADSLRMLSAAPLFDSGNSMFFADERTKPYTRRDILERTITAFHDKEEKMLTHVRDRNAVKAELLPSPRSVKTFYVKNGIPEERADFIAKSYAVKLELLKDFQRGMTISLYHEKRRK